MRTINEYANTALDATYAQTAAPMLAHIQTMSTGRNSAMQAALRELEAEANAISAQTDDPNAATTRLDANNAHLQKAMLALGAVFAAAGTLIAAIGSIEESGQGIAIPAVTAKVFTGLANSVIKKGGDPVSADALASYLKILDEQGATWNAPTTALDFAKQFVETDAWIARMEGWGPGYSDLINQTILDGIAQGWGPKQIASKMRQYAEGMPVSAAENLTRTLQLTSYREASLAMESMNSQFIEYKIRICALKPTSCLNCISLHGTRLEVGERVDDHYNGFCSEFLVTYGGPRFPEFMQADSTPGNRNFIPFQTGEDWFASLPPERQAQQDSFRKSPAKLKAYQDGTPLSAFRGEHQDPVFGRQTVELSLKAALGDMMAAQYRSK